MSTQNNGAPEFVPVVIIGAGPTGIAAATLLGQYGVECLVLDRHETVYPLPRAVHADDECTAYSPGWASARSSPPTAGQHTVFG
jgi:cation diffusion facilitator CzcD-associated flavoprotein CzcO